MIYQITSRPASLPTSLTPLRPNPHLTTSPSTKSHRRLNVSRSNRTLTRSRPWWRYCGTLRHSLDWAPQPLLGKRDGPTRLPTPHSSVLVGHTNTTPPDQPLIPPDAHRCSPPRTIAVSGEIFVAPGYGLVPRTLWHRRGHEFESHFEHFSSKKCLRVRLIISMSPWVPRIWIEVWVGIIRTSVHGDPSSATSQTSRRPKGGGECYKDYPGLGNRSIFYPGSSVAGSTITYSCKTHDR